jgi:hypothetical protein
MANDCAGDLFTGYGLKVIRWGRENIVMFLIPPHSGIKLKDEG